MESNHSTTRSIASLVLENHRIVPVLEKYSIDFCCRGKMSLEDACKDKGIDPAAVLKEMEAVGAEEKTKQMPFTEMTEAQLVNHIVTTHHYYVKNTMPVIAGHLDKIATKHGDSFPYMLRVKELFEIIYKEMDLHMKKEETILFPRIEEIEKSGGQADLFPAGYISGPIAMMEHEHDSAGNALRAMRQGSNGYSAPTNSCISYQTLYNALAAFETDLHQHIHLENNILFPRAVAMERAR